MTPDHFSSVCPLTLDLFIPVLLHCRLIIFAVDRGGDVSELLVRRLLSSLARQFVRLAYVLQGA